jgi:hypothetical protein
MFANLMRARVQVDTSMRDTSPQPSHPRQRWRQKRRMATNFLSVPLYCFKRELGVAQPLPTWKGLILVPAINNVQNFPSQSGKVCWLKGDQIWRNFAVLEKFFSPGSSKCGQSFDACLSTIH